MSIFSSRTRVGVDKAGNRYFVPKRSSAFCKYCNSFALLPCLPSYFFNWPLFRGISIVCGYLLCGDFHRKIITVQRNDKSCGKSKYKFWCIVLFITVKLEQLINDWTAQIKRTAPAELFHFCRWYDSLFRVRAVSIEWKKILLRVSINRNDATNSTSINPSNFFSQMIFYFRKISFNCA
jgi:hypothetical protein